MRKKIACIIMAFSIFSTAAGAAEILNCETDENGVVTIEQKLSSGKKGEEVSLLIYRLGMGYENLSPDNAIDVVAESVQTVSGDEGVYKFRFKIDGQSGFYKAQLSDQNKTAEYEMLYSNPEEGRAVLAELKAQSSKDEFYKLISQAGADGIEGYKKLGFYLDLGVEADNKKVSDLLFDYIKNNTFDETKATFAAKLYKKLYCIELLNEGKSAELGDMEKYLMISDEDFYEEYSRSYFNDLIKKSMIDSLKNKNFKSVEEYKNAFLEIIVMNTVKYADGYGRIEDILKKYSTETGINTSNYDSDDYKYVMGKSYSDYASLKADLAKEKSSSVNSGSSGGSGGNGREPSKSGSVPSLNLGEGVIKNNIPTPVEIKAFDDLEDYSWAEESIEYLFERKIISGKDERIFCPADLITRAEFAKLIVDAFGISGSGENVFTDVNEDDWYYKYVNAAYNAGIVSGLGEGIFAPNAQITRQDICVMLSRALRISEENEWDEIFSDGESISDYAKNAVYYLKSKSVISGFEDNTFRPLNFATRAEASVMIYRAIV